MNHILCLLIVSVALLTGTVVLTAQLPDIRLSTEPTSSTLPTDIQIQSAASIGNRTLVVWGSGALDADSGFRPILRMQMLEGNQLIGEQGTIHSDEARPYGVVRVLPAGNQFVILWNDRQDTPTVYGMSVDTGGVVINAEGRFFTGTVRAVDDIQLLPFDDGSSMVVANVDYNGNRRMVYRRVPSNGGLFGEESEISGGVYAQMLRYDLLPGLVVIRRVSGDGIVVHPNGAIDERRIPLERLNNAFYLDADLSFAMVDDSVFSLFANMFDSTAVLQVRLPVPEGYIDGNMIGRDSLGRVEVYRSRGDLWGRDAIIFYVLRWTIAANGMIAKHDTTLKIESGLGSDQSWLLDSITKLRGCSNRSHIIVSTFIENRQPGGRPAFNVPFRINYGWFQGSFYRDTFPSPSAFQCDSVTYVGVTRKSSSGVSDVLVSTGGSGVIVSHDIPEFYLSIPQKKPVVIQRQGEVLTTWLATTVNGTFNVVSQWSGWDSSLEKGAENCSVRIYKSSVYGSESYSWDAADAIYANSVALCARRSFTSNVHDAIYITHVSRIGLLLPSPSGWLKVFTRIDSARNDSPKPQPSEDDSWFRLHQIALDPDNGQTIAAVSNRRTKVAWLFGISEQGEINWIDSSKNGLKQVIESGALIPVSPRTVLFINSAMMKKVIDGVVTDSINLASPKTARFIPLLGTNFLRYYPDSTSKRHYTFDILDTNGSIFHHADVTLDVDPLDLTIAQRPADSSLYLIYASNTGIHTTVLSSRLVVQRQHRQISAGSDSTRNPSAVFINDYLAVAWEDYRNGVADIYGTIRSAEAILSTEAVAGDDGSGVITISPNPVSDVLRIELPASLDGTMLELYDPMGRQVLSREIDNAAQINTLDVSSITSGVYTIVVRTEEKVRRQQVVVVQ
jgi:hypothetical protein